MCSTPNVNSCVILTTYTCDTIDSHTQQKVPALHTNLSVDSILVVGIRRVELCDGLPGNIQSTRVAVATHTTRIKYLPHGFWNHRVHRKSGSVSCRVT